MIHDLQPYPAMKDSDVPWLGEVPAHWEVLPNRALFLEVKDRDRIDEQMLSVTISQGVIRQATLLTNSSKKDSSNEDKANYKLVCPGDIAYNKMRAWQGAVGVSRYQGIVSPAYVVVRPRGKQNSRYFHYLLRTPSFAKEAERWSYGITSDQWSLRPEHFKMIYCSLPSETEQAQIVAFLAQADGQFNRLIRAKRRLIELLNEQKQAIVHRAVTRGLDPNVRLESSGIDGLGEVPEHWEVLPFTKCATERADYRGATPEKVDSGVFLVTAKNIRRGWIDYECSKEYVREDQYQHIMRRGMPRIGDILLTMEAPLGHVALIDREDIALAQRVIRFRLDERRFVPRFAMLSMLSPYFQNQLLVRATGSTAHGIKASKLPQLLILQPPIGEQKGMMRAIASETEGSDRAINRSLREIDRLREYRTRLIADVVTGKLDVRGVELPAVDELDGSTAGEDAEAWDEGEEVEDSENGEGADEEHEA